ncbi:MAG: hypothetical protein MUF16_14440 [Burkholderiaceae bacterium]|jgi:hypothetical protein|nr:hypothetical protein [Burkholderiaceae bacterium]
MAVTTVVPGLGQRLGLGQGVGKQQHIGHVFAPLAREVDLRQVVSSPTEFGQHAFDDQLLGLRFVDRCIRAQFCVDALQCVVEAADRSVAQLLPGRSGLDAAEQKLLGEELALHVPRRLGCGSVANSERTK